MLGADSGHSSAAPAAGPGEMVAASAPKGLESRAAAVMACTCAQNDVPRRCLRVAARQSYTTRGPTALRFARQDSKIARIAVLISSTF